MGSSIGQTNFYENKGQWNEVVRFQYSTNGAEIYLKNGAISFLQYDIDKWSSWMHDHGGERDKHEDETDFTLDFHHFELQFENSSLACYPKGVGASEHTINYFLGDDPDKWVSDARAYHQVKYENLYPGVDLVASSIGHGFKYDFKAINVEALKQVKLRYKHVDGITVKDDEIRIKTSLGKIKESMPLCYVEYEGSREAVQCFYILNEDGSIGIEVQTPIDGNPPITIDPEVVFATYAGNTADNFGFTATYDDEGHLYAGGITEGPTLSWDPSGRYPATTGAFSENYAGGSSNDYPYHFPCDITISKYDSAGTNLIYATYIGGSSNEYPHSIVADKDQNLVIFGTSFSPNYPTTIGSYQALKKGDQDMIITKLNKAGSALIGSTFMGGKEKDGLNEATSLNYFFADNHRGEVILDTFGQIYVASNTLSIDFPMKDAAQASSKGRQEGIFMQLSSDLTELLWSTYIGGPGDDALYSVDFNTEGMIYLSGGTNSSSLSNTTGTVGESFNGGSADGFIVQLDPVAKSIVRASYWGTRQYDQIFSLDIDDEDNVYVVGHSLGAMPVQGDVYSNDKSGQFITKFNPELNKVILTTTFGSGDSKLDITVNAFLVDECQKIFVSGWGGRTSTKTFSSTRKLPITADAYQSATDGSDFYLLVLSKDARELLYATYFGGNKTADHVDGGTSRFDKKGIIYQSVCASCPGSFDPGGISDFPTTPNSYAPTNSSPRCSNAAFKIAFGNLNRKPRLKDDIYVVQALDTVDFSYFINDPDYDSLFVTFDPDAKLKSKLYNFPTYVEGFRDMKVDISIIAQCEDVGDTLNMLVDVVDKGCPESKDSSAMIRIVVTPPPVLDPPNALCLVFIGSDAIELSWDAIEESHYFGRMELWRRNPDGSEQLVHTTTSWGAGAFQDNGLDRPKERNYTYFIRVVNKCDEAGPNSLAVSSTKEFESPINSTYLVTASVTDDEYVEVHWAHSTEADFGYYDVYRKVNSPKDDWELVASTYNLYDTFYIDKSVQVQKESYCYAIVVNDNCGHVSRQSNQGCTIVLSGIEKPFEFDLNWNEYFEWENGVDHYVLDRSVDTGILRPIISTDYETLWHTDSMLDYCWGGYWYRITAHQRSGSYDAISRSNKIYLIQPPLLHVPNAFTPNGDGLNELWGIVPVFVKEYQISVFNRWGEKVYESTNVKKDWKGEYKDLLRPNTVYIYTILYTGWDRSVHTRKGTVTIIK